MKKNSRSWTVVFMQGMLPQFVKKYKSVDSAKEAMTNWEGTDIGAPDNGQWACIVKTDNRPTHSKKAIATEDLPTVFVRTDGPLAHLAVEVPAPNTESAPS